MLFFIPYCIFIFLFLEIIEIDHLINLNDYYITLFSIFYLYNFFFLNISSINGKEKINIDLIFKYLYLSFRNPGFFLNYYANMFKKLFLHLFGFKYCYVYEMYKIYKLKYNYLLMFWRPLFKKSSYFGYYRSNRSKWIK